MDKTVLITLLVASGLGMPAWMAWRKAHKRPYVGGWLASLLLALPFALTLWLHPDWLGHPMTDAVRFLVLLPAFLALSALGGGLVYLLGPLALALLLGTGKAFGEAFKNVEWRQDDDRAVETESSWATDTNPSKERFSYEYDLYELDDSDVFDVYSEKG